MSPLPSQELIRVELARIYVIGSPGWITIPVECIGLWYLSLIVYLSSVTLVTAPSTPDCNTIGVVPSHRPLPFNTRGLARPALAATLRALAHPAVAVTLRALARPAVAATAIMIIRAIVAATTRALVHAVAATAIMIIRAIVAATTRALVHHAMTATAIMIIRAIVAAPTRALVHHAVAATTHQQEKEKEKVKVKPSRAAATGSRTTHERALEERKEKPSRAAATATATATTTTTHERALEERIAPSLPRQAKRARSVVGEQDDRDGSKRQRQEASPETAPPETAPQENNRVLMKLRADFYTVEYNPDDGRWHQIRPGMTPVLATDGDKDRYERAKDLLALHGAK
ncbi:hypothetical protein C8F04DRAFT_1197449 [Mycena alexandri]|uniref:Uncharacterized protein n=1 Tax=Mycena alexandri TaxID=1745969 RepID=A0AAD6S256_9AGAR|nr:hypothetical protein C8F04DRAFT_1197449 [Mycena alexandri]